MPPLQGGFRRSRQRRPHTYPLAWEVVDVTTRRAESIQPGVSTPGRRSRIDKPRRAGMPVAGSQLPPGFRPFGAYRDGRWPGPRGTPGRRGFATSQVANPLPERFATRQAARWKTFRWSWTGWTPSALQLPPLQGGFRRSKKRHPRRVSLRVEVDGRACPPGGDVPPSPWPAEGVVDGLGTSLHPSINGVSAAQAFRAGPADPRRPVIGQGSAVVGRAGGLAGQAGLAAAVLALVRPDREPSRGLLELAPGQAGQRLPLKDELFGCSLHSVLLLSKPQGGVPSRSTFRGVRWAAERALAKAMLLGPAPASSSLTASTSATRSPAPRSRCRTRPRRGPGR